jgi:hypothetical protein
MDELTHRFLDSRTAMTVATYYPQFQPLLDRWQSGEMLPHSEYNRHRVDLVYKVPFGEPWSVWHDFVQLILSNISRHIDFTKHAEDVICHLDHTSLKRFHKANIMEVVNMSLRPWAIYGIDELIRLDQVVGLPDQSLPDDNWNDKSCSQSGPLRRYSAASLAIRFLQSLHNDTQTQFRTIKLLEDKTAINNPPSHVLGLIPFCRRNPDLHIERSVTLWTAGICHR